MDPDFRNAHVDQSLNLPLPHAHTAYQGASSNTSMGCCFPAVLEYHPHHGMDHAMPTVACGVGRSRYMYDQGGTTGNRTCSGNNKCGQRLLVCHPANCLSMARADRSQDKAGPVDFDVLGRHHWIFLSGPNNLKRRGVAAGSDL